MRSRQLVWVLLLSGLKLLAAPAAGCRRGLWQCDDGNCVPEVWRCDGDGDCLDGSDEMDCTAAPGSPPCPSGSDELSCAETGCLDSDWTCQNHICVPKELRCDGHDDCTDGSDEKNCAVCPEDGVQCPEGGCASAEQLCDGVVHCSDGSDEPLTCGRICSVNNGGCSHMCVDRPWGALCVCPAGYQLSASGAVCSDVDECKRSFPPCLHLCTNTVGSFYCHCREGFRLEGNVTCVPTGNATRLLTVRRRTVGLLDVKTQQFEALQTLKFDPVALTFDLTRGRYYWADGQGIVYGSDGRNSWTLFTGVPGVRGLACDWLNGNLFWTNERTASIHMLANGGKSYMTVLSKDVVPSELVVLPGDSLMFWINGGARATIERSWMDGADRRSVSVITAQVAHGLTADVAARRIYWISDAKQSVETVKVDGTGRFSFTGMFSRRAALSLAAFGGSIFWGDDKGLWQIPQSRPHQRSFIWKSTPPLFTPYHELQQPPGSSACVNTPCDICLLTKANPAGFTCTCPHSKVLMPDGACQHLGFVYATTGSVNLLQFTDGRSTDTQIFSTEDGVLSFDLDWYRDWIYWVNRTGHVQRTGLTRVQTEPVPTPLPVCLVRVDQRSGKLFWVSCDQSSIVSTDTGRRSSEHLYHTTKDIQDLFLDWLRGRILWLEDQRIFTMSVTGDRAKELLHLGDVLGPVTFDLRAGSLLWKSDRAGLMMLSLLQERSHAAGSRWNVSGSVVGALEPFLLSLSDGVVTVWDRRDGRRLHRATVGRHAFNMLPALKDVGAVPVSLVCKEPSVLCRQTSICLDQTRLCDGTVDCPEGDDEDVCVTCSENDTFRCKDGNGCVPLVRVCDGRSHCSDGSDEVDCPSSAAQPRCRLDSRPCADATECVSLSHVCDGERDCRDGSDERGCGDGPVTPWKPSARAPSTPPACVRPSVLCPRTSIHRCVSPSQFCDGRRDCPDGFDERDCVSRCSSPSDFRCRDRRSCVSEAQVCDGRSHCNDGSDEVGCPSAAPPAARTHVPKCRLGSRLCDDGTECVLLGHVCDGETDCQDGSDERGCDAVQTTADVLSKNQPTNPSSSPIEATSTVPLSTVPPRAALPSVPPCVRPSVLCPGSTVCIGSTQLCDGTRDCPDGSDEVCVRRCASRSDFRCRDRRSCVSEAQVCDGRSHCNDGSDEVGCPSAAPPAARTHAPKCRLGSRLCDDGTECVLLGHVCDGETDCQDGSDERGCAQVPGGDRPAMETSRQPLTTRPCSGPLFLCSDSSSCVQPSQLCDGRKDCADGSDETCLSGCDPPGDVFCKDRQRCISRSQVCDGRSDCGDGSDEVGCQRTAPSAAVPAVVPRCRLGSKPCDDGTVCVSHGHVCDGETDCPDGSDERGCPETCRPDEFRCSHGKRCVPAAQVCDGRAQCRDRSDEQNCWEATTSCEHRCPDGSRCIPNKFLCDGERDCTDGSDEQGCDPVSSVTPEPRVATPASACVSPSVLCPRSSVCISQTQLCDGRADCPDASDESVCVVQCQNPGDFLCSDRRKCVPRSEVCDGRAHCPDGSDERRCHAVETPASSSSSRSAPLRCRKGFRLCGDGLECVMYSHVCDGEKDCPDGSDEDDCVTDCKADEFQCSHGNRCIPRAQVCDGHGDCQDRSDETSCRTAEGCDRRCDNNTRCIPDTFLCDGERDCADGSDEETCATVSCAVDQFRCASGQCMSEALRCDGYADCSDRSDEAECGRPPHCPPQLRCPHSHVCLQREWMCDGEDDCGDGADEKNCPVPVVKCREHQWQCGASAQCVPLSWRCDGRKDCHNGADEDKCPQRKCPPHVFQCGSGECLEPSLACNRITNCADRSDEGAGCSRSNCSGPSAPGCDHQCVSTPIGPRCYCAAGFTLSSGATSCWDVDECSSPQLTHCKHTCINTRGSYRCFCHIGFYLEPDGGSCKAREEPLLLASVQSELLLLGVHSGTLRLLSSATRPVFSVDYLWAQQRIYWLSPDYQSIRWAHVTDARSKGTLIKGVKLDFIAVDWVGKNLYWLDGLVGQILAVQLSDSMVASQDSTVVLGEDLEQPSSLVLLPHRGLMLWSEIGSTPHIRRSGMDGSRRSVVVSSGLSWPVSLAVDLLDERVYWADEKLRCIGSASLDGDDVKILQLAETPSPFSVAVFNDRLYWSDTKRRTIRSADKNTGKDQKVLLKRPGQPFGLKLMHQLSQPLGFNPCDQLRCSHLCLLAPALTGRSGSGGDPATGKLRAVCRCPKGLVLSKDQTTCSPPVESTFILLLSHSTIYQLHLHSIRREGVALKKMPSGRVLALPGVSEASGVDVSLRGASLYVSDSREGSVDVLRLSSSRSRQGLTPVGRVLRLEDDAVTALAVDWVTSSLYWSSTRRPDVHVTSRYNNRTASLLLGPHVATTSIALHPPTGRICFTALAVAGGRSQTQVNCAWMDGRSKAVLWKKSSIPTSLVFSNKGTLIYWADTGEGVISSIGVDGSGYKQFNTGTELLVSFSRVDNFLLWVTVDKDVRRLWFSDGLQPKQLWFETKTSLTEVCGFSNDSQSGTNVCSNNNGGCEQLCLPRPGGRTCKCARGFYSVNVTSCGPAPPCPSGEESCSDGSRCISSRNFCDGRVDCTDTSDEQDCPDLTLSTTHPLRDGATPRSRPNALNHNTSPASCDQQRCRGDCVTEGGASRCQDRDGGRNHVAVGVGVVCLAAALTGAFICTKRRGGASFRSRSAEKETLMSNMGSTCEQHESDTEELDSSIDAKNPPLTSQPLQPESTSSDDLMFVK